MTGSKCPDLLQETAAPVTLLPEGRSADQLRRIDRTRHRRTAAVDLEVQVRASREPGRVLQPEHGARRHLIAVADQHRLQVRVADPEIADLDLDVVGEVAAVDAEGVAQAAIPSVLAGLSEGNCQSSSRPAAGPRRPGY